MGSLTSLNWNALLESGYHAIYVTFTQRWVQRQRQLAGAKRLRMWKMTAAMFAVVREAMNRRVVNAALNATLFQTRHDTLSIGALR